MDTVNVTGGQVKGSYIENNEFVEFKGILYAASTAGENRWKAPQDVVAWEGVKDCTAWGANAMQGTQAPFSYWTEEFIVSSTEYNEDCLNLNVWTKNVDTEANRPVIVYIHGGGFNSGGSSCEVYSGSQIAKQDVVYVSINYRVGIYGFFANTALKEEDANGSAGNYGLMDQIKALEWVQENIEKFGGDPDNVTIMGQSAGASSVNYLSVSPVAKGLFKRAVANSYDDINGAKMLVSYIGTMADRITANDAASANYTLEQIRAMTTEEVSAARGRSVSAGGPCVDGYVVPKTYGEALAAGALGDIDVMTGIVDNDANDGATSFMDQMMLDRGFFPSAHDDNFTAGDSLIANQNAIAVARKAANDTGSTYIYKFSKIMLGSTNDYAFHTSDVPYFLNYFVAQRAEVWTDDDRATGAAASAYLVNFAKTGNPNGEGLATWDASTGGYSYMEINATCAQQTFSAEKIAAIKAYVAVNEASYKFPAYY